MNYLAGDAEVRRLAELRDKWERDRVSAINYATRKGAKENSLQIAKEMLKRKMPKQTIMKITKLSLNEIEKISPNY